MLCESRQVCLAQSTAGSPVMPAGVAMWRCCLNRRRKPLSQQKRERVWMIKRCLRSDEVVCHRNGWWGFKPNGLFSPQTEDNVTLNYGALSSELVISEEVSDDWQQPRVRFVHMHWIWNSPAVTCKQRDKGPFTAVNQQCLYWMFVCSVSLFLISLKVTH